MNTFFSAPFLCIAHRGASAHAPENTLAAFERAVELGAHAVEVDVHLVEEIPVVIHDAYLARTTNGRGPVETCTLEKLRRLDAGNGERVPLLAEVLEALDGRVGINVELKAPGTGAAVVKLLQRWRMDPASVLLSSFERKELAVAAAAGPELPRGLLVHPLRHRRDPVAHAREVGACALHVDTRLVGDALLERARKAALPVLVYTVNDPQAIANLAKRGAAGVFTDDPCAWQSAMDSDAHAHAGPSRSQPGNG